MFYRVNILQEMISDALRKLLPEYSLQISIVESTEQLLMPLATVRSILLWPSSVICLTINRGVYRPVTGSILCHTHHVTVILCLNYSTDY